MNQIVIILFLSLLDFALKVVIVAGAAMAVSNVWHGFTPGGNHPRRLLPCQRRNINE
jgi:hypothetical protein